MAVRSTASGRLTRTRIVTAVTELLENGGIDAVSTRTVGEALDVHPTALYRHFRDMDELLREAADGILAEVVNSLPDAGGPDPLSSVSEICLRLRQVLMAHPGAARVMSAGPSRMPQERVLTERVLLLLHEAGLDDARVALAYHALIEYTVGSSAIDSFAGGTTDAEVEARHRVWRADYLAVAPTDFPTTSRVARWLYPSQQQQYEYGLSLMLAALRQECAGKGARRRR